MQEAFQVGSRHFSQACALCGAEDANPGGVRGHQGERPGNPEARLRWKATQAYKLAGFAVYDLEQNRRTRQTPGVADVLLLGHGLQVWVEFKDGEKRQLSDAQRLFREHVGRNGGLYYVQRHLGDTATIIEELKCHPDWRDRP